MSTIESTTETTAPTTATLRCQFCLSWNRVNVSRAADRPKCGSCARPKLCPTVFLPWNRRRENPDQPRSPNRSYACATMFPAVTAQRFDIRAIPTVIVFRDGKEARRQAGAGPLPMLEGLLA